MQHLDLRQFLRSPIRRDMLVVTVCVIISFAITTGFDLNENLVLWQRDHPESPLLDLEDLPFAFMFIAFGTAWFAVRRWREYRSESFAHEATMGRLTLAMEEVVAANQAKGQFLANMSHELRTPLNAVIGFSEILKGETLGPAHPNYRGYAANIYDSGSHLLKIINDILDMSKIEAGKLELQEMKLDLGEIVVGCVRLMREGALEAGVRLVYEPLAAPRTISGDPAKVKQILLNVLSNSVKFTSRGGTVTIVLFMADDNRLAIEMRDTGIGMSAEDIAIALQPFRQIDNSHSRQYPGTGLGLALAKALTELHGGELRVVSEVGRGTMVTVLLPALPRSSRSG